MFCSQIRTVRIDSLVIYYHNKIILCFPVLFFIDYIEIVVMPTATLITEMAEFYDKYMFFFLLNLNSFISQQYLLSNFTMCINQQPDPYSLTFSRQTMGAL